MFYGPQDGSEVTPTKEPFVTIPNASYKPISSDGSIGSFMEANWNKHWAEEHAKRAKDPMFMNPKELKDEDIQQIVDFISPFRGMFVPASLSAERILNRVGASKEEMRAGLEKIANEKPFSDIVTKTHMRWIDDDEAYLRPHKEVVNEIIDRYYPKELRRENFKSDDEWQKALSDELERLKSEEDDILKNGPLQDLNDVLMHKEFLTDPELMTDRLHSSDGRNMYKLDQVLHHPKLFEAYPHLKNMDFKYDASASTPHFDPNNDVIVMPSHLANPEDAFEVHRLNRITLHETQHAVQEYAGWPRGGNTEMFQADYDKKIGDILDEVSKSRHEAEARLIKLQTDLRQAPADKDIQNKVKKAENDLRKANMDVIAVQEQLDNVDTPHESYLKLYGERQSRAVEAAYNRTEITSQGEYQPGPWQSLKDNEGAIPTSEDLITYGRGVVTQ